MTYEEYRLSRMSNLERQGIMMLDMLSRSFAASYAPLAARIEKAYKWGKRDLGMIAGAIGRLKAAALSGVQEDIQQTIDRQSRDFVLGLERRSPVRKGQEIVMPIEDEWQLIQIAMTERCSVCVKDSAECRRCELRKLLRRYTNEPEPEFDTCGFMGFELSPDVRGSNRQEGI